ncbi:MAG: hypothetical protein G01um101433_1084 [Parcubacteria group bacterium Gr01-1014_33]|nr:MAG: hypothetical protein G01um101433_1084 [Parcubacteria group bacterium Gr01-1014_33]
MVISLQAKIKLDIVTALRSKEELQLSVLRMLAAALQNREIEKHAKISGAVLDEEEVVATVRSEAKKRRDAIEGFKKGGRKELAEKEAAELKILEAYLPQELSEEEIEKIVQDVLGQLGELTQKDFGRVMKEVMGRVKGQASGERVSEAVKKFLRG